jgi:hypothetical protein
LVPHETPAFDFNGRHPVPSELQHGLGPGSVTGDARVADLPTWEIWVIVVGGSVSVFLLCVVLALLIRWLTGVREPPALALFVAGEIVGFFRRRLFRRAARPAPEPVHSDPAIAVLPGSSPPI